MVLLLDYIGQIFELSISSLLVPYPRHTNPNFESHCNTADLPMGKSTPRQLTHRSTTNYAKLISKSSKHILPHTYSIWYTLPKDPVVQLKSKWQPCTRLHITGEMFVLVSSQCHGSMSPSGDQQARCVNRGMWEYILIQLSRDMVIVSIGLFLGGGGYGILLETYSFVLGIVNTFFVIYVM